MVLFNLKKDASHVRKLMSNSLVDFCRASFKYDTELNIEGMLCVTVDKQDVLPIPVNILLQKTSKPMSSSVSLNNSFTQAAAMQSKDRNQDARGNTSLEIQPDDLHSAQAVLQSLLAKTPTSQAHDFIPLDDMGNIEGVNTQNRQAGSSIKLEASNIAQGRNEENVDIDDEDMNSSQDSQFNKGTTLQDAVGNVIKTYYQENPSLQQQQHQQMTSSAAATAAVSKALNAPLTVIKIQANNNMSRSPKTNNSNLTVQQKLSNSLPWKREAPKKFQCPMCNYTSDRRFCINRHMKLHVGRAGVQCQICRNIFADHWYLTKVHMPKHHPEHLSSNANSTSSNAATGSGGAINTTAAGATAQTLASPTNRLSTTATTSTATNSLTAKECSIQCPVCPFNASSALSFRNHLNTHSRDCLRCGLRFLTPDDVQQHVRQQHGDDVDFSECIYDPDMAEHMENDALQNAVHLTPENSARATTVVGDREGVGAQDSSQDSIEMTSEELDGATGLYAQEDGSEVPMLMNQNYMMVVNNESNQVEFINPADGTVVEGIVCEDGQLYTTQEVPVDHIIKKEHDEMEERQNGDEEIEEEEEEPRIEHITEVQ